MAVPFPVVANIVQLVVESNHTPSPQIGQNGINFRVAAIAGTGITLQQIGDSMRTTVQGVFPAANSAAVQLSGVYARLLDSTTGRVTQSTRSPDNATLGSIAGGITPSQVSPVSSLSTGLAGRKFRGRSYFPFPSITFINASGELTVGAEAIIQAYLAALFTTQLFTVGANSTSLVPVLLHRKPLPLTYTDLVGTAVPTGRLGTQRRRGDYGRPNTPL